MARHATAHFSSHSIAALRVSSSRCLSIESRTTSRFGHRLWLSSPFSSSSAFVHPHLLGGPADPLAGLLASLCESSLFQAPTLSEIAEKLNRSDTATKARAYMLRVGLGRFRIRRHGLSKWG